jgi:(E)-4-hydroxy-3-methylbut-2-enyl-diphosphate synthase|tara:strand:- start:18158 stop:20071 length:1914 start_codon:yes stop_codon:yes gene_type:complete
MDNKSNKPYCVDIYNRKRLKTLAVNVGPVGIGGENPIRLQSMTTTNTMDTDLSIQQSARMIDAGCELVRLTAPSKNEAYNLKNIREGLQKLGYKAPLVADIHFTPNAAEIAAEIVEKVRVNPGNYADKKKFEDIIYTDEAYSSELERIELKFTPLVLLCKEKKTAMRIGTNHGSLSDRILSRYGDTPLGMVESAMEFIRICEKHDYHELVISMKASNTVVMVQAYRLLAATMLENGRCYPLHLGVTEAGDGEDGRIKSAVGIGALLEDGLGDTIRVSLTEEPEFEIPVARKLAEKYKNQNNIHIINYNSALTYSPYYYEKHHGIEHHNIGGSHVPVVFADLSGKDAIKPANFFGFGYTYSIELDKWNLMDQAADYVYIGENEINFEVPGTLGVVVDYNKWLSHYQNKSGYYPLTSELIDVPGNYFFQPKGEFIVSEDLKNHPNAIFILTTKYDNKTQVFRKIINELANYGLKNPIILRYEYDLADEETFQLYSSSDAGSILIDGFGEGLWITANQPIKTINATSFGILQATRTRISKTEYISCPSCGRTLFDLQETTAKIRKRTSHLKGLKIGIMGCIVNGPGEMADADYGYVGTGPGKINLYKEKTVVAKNIPEEEAVEALVELIRKNGDWIEAKD